MGLLLFAAVLLLFVWLVVVCVHLRDVQPRIPCGSSFEPFVCGRAERALSFRLGFEFDLVGDLAIILPVVCESLESVDCRVRHCPLSLDLQITFWHKFLSNSFAAPVPAARFRAASNARPAPQSIYRTLPRSRLPLPPLLALCALKLRIRKCASRERFVIEVEHKMGNKCHGVKQSVVQRRVNSINRELRMF